MRCPSVLVAIVAFCGAVQGNIHAHAQFARHALQGGRAVLHGGRTAPQPPAASPAPGSGADPTAALDSPPSGRSSFGHHHQHHGQGGGGAWPLTYPWYGPPYFGPVWYSYAPPMVLPAGALYGPPAANGILGWNAPAPLAANLPAPRVVPRPANGGAVKAGAQRPGVGGFGVLAEEEGKDANSKKRRASNAESVARARQFVVFGDERFHSQDYSEAYQRYKKAAVAAPDLADAYLRQGFALTAMGRYAQAAKALRRGLTLKPELAQSRLRLDDLYGENQLAKVTQLEQLATAATERPEEADLMFVLGVTLHFDGQAARARLFFQRAQELGADRESIAGFLKPMPAVGKAAAGQEL